MSLQISQAHCFCGLTMLRTSGEETELSLVLHDVIFVPDLLSNLISFSRSCDNGYIIKFGGSMCTGMYDGFMIPNSQV